MSLTQEDLLQIRSIVESVVKPLIEPVQGKIEALRNDIEEIYDKLVKLERSAMLNTGFQKLSIEDKLSN